MILPVPGPPASSEQFGQPVISPGLHYCLPGLPLLPPLGLGVLSRGVGLLGHHQAGQQQGGRDEGEGLHDGLAGLVVGVGLVT